MAFDLFKSLKKCRLTLCFDYMIQSVKIRYQWLHRFDSVTAKHQIFEKNHRQRKWYINASIRG